MNFIKKNSRLYFYTILVSLLILTGCKTNYRLSSKAGTNLPINEHIKEDSTVFNYYLPYKKELEKRMNQQIGTAAQAFIRNRNSPETFATNMFADAMLTIGKSIDPTVLLALGTKDGIRTDINKGAITVGHIFEFMPFENFFTIIEISGKDFYELCEFIAQAGGQPIAGFRMKIKDGKPLAIEVDGEPFDLNKQYKLITYDYIANGGDLVRGLNTPIRREDTNIRVHEGLIDYIEQLTKENKQLNAQLDGRITIVQ